MEESTHDPLNVQIWIHQSNLLWSRLQTITAIQVGAFTGWYFLREKNLCMANGLLGLAILLIICVGFLMYRDTRYMDHFGSTILPSSIRNAFPRGRDVGYFLLGVLALSNVILLLSSLQCRDTQSPPPSSPAQSCPAIQTGVSSPP
jgi:hypothetical protein